MSRRDLDRKSWRRLFGCCCSWLWPSGGLFMAPRFITPVPRKQGNNRAQKQKSRPSPGGDAVAKVAYFAIRYVRSPASFLLALDREAHLLGEVAGDEAPDAVVLPVGGLGDLGHRRAVLAAQEVEDDGLLAELARYGGVLGFGRLLAGGLRVLLGGLLAGGGLRCPSWRRASWRLSWPWARPSSCWPSSRWPSPARRSRPVPQRRRLRWSWWRLRSFSSGVYPFGG